MGDEKDIKKSTTPAVEGDTGAAQNKENFLHKDNNKYFSVIQLEALLVFCLKYHKDNLLSRPYDNETSGLVSCCDCILDDIGKEGI